MVRPIRSVGRPRNATKKGGKRANAGKKKGPIDQLGKRGIEERVLKAKRMMEAWDEWPIIRAAFVSLVKQKLCTEAGDCVEMCTVSNEIAKAQKMKLDAKVPGEVSPQEALAIVLHLFLTKFQYSEVSVMINEASRLKLMPCYDKVRLCKALCRPDDGIQIFEHKASVKVQSIFNHTVRRIIEAYGAEIDAQLPSESLLIDHPCHFIATYGMDAATGQREYKQPFDDPDNYYKSDASLFAVVLNPLLIKTAQGNKIWANAVPQSPKNVRPILIEFQKESLNYVISIHKAITAELRALQPVSVVTPAGHSLKVSGAFHLTLIDGKIFNILTKTNSNQCPTCKAPPEKLGDPAYIGTRTFAPKGAGLKYGLQPMHAYIKVFMQLFKLACYKPVQKLKERTQRPVPRAKAKELRAKRKKEIQDAYLPFGLRIDFPAQFGSGNTLDGNTCRRVFADPEFLAKTLDLDVDIVRRFRIVLICINNTRYKLNVPEYEAYCHRLFRDYHNRYNYYKMSPSVHKILIHGGQVQAQLDIAVGAAGEGAAEAKHRERKRTRDKNTRKTNRRDHMTDVLFREMDSSDPVIAKRILERSACFRKKECEALALLPDEARKVLVIDTSDSPSVNQSVAGSNGSSVSFVAEVDNAVPGPSRNCRIVGQPIPDGNTSAQTESHDVQHAEDDPEYADADYQDKDYGTDYDEDDDEDDNMEVD